MASTVKLQNSEPTKSTDDISYGEMFLVTEGTFKGCVVTKYYNGIVLLYAPKGVGIHPFETTWGDPSFKGRLLTAGESVTLTNE